MANYVDVNVKVGANITKAKEDIKALEGTPVKVPVTADVDAAKKAINGLISQFNGKTIKLRVDTSQVAKNLNSSLVNQTSNITKNIQKAFKGVQLSGAVDRRQMSAYVKNLQSQFEAAGKKVKVGWGFLGDGPNSDMFVRIKEANGAVQQLTYSMKETGNASQYMLKGLSGGAIANASSQIEKCRTSVKKLHSDLEKGLKSGKIDQNQYNAGMSQVGAIQSQIKAMEQGAYVTQAAINKVNASIAKAGRSLVQPASIANATKAISQIESAQKKLNSALSSGSIGRDPFLAMSQGLQNLRSHTGDLKYVTEELSNFEKALALQKDRTKRQNNLQKQFESFQKSGDKFRTWLKSSGKTMSTEAQGILKTFDDLTAKHKAKPGSVLADDFKNATASASKYMSQFGKVGTGVFDGMLTKAKEIGTFMMANFGFQVAIQGIKSMANNVIELDTAMTNLKKVSDGSKQDYQDFMNGAAETAQNVGRKVSEVIESASTWSSAGYNLKEAQTLAEASTKYLNISDYDNIDDASKSLLSTLKAYHMEASDVTKVLDEFNQVGELPLVS